MKKIIATLLSLTMMLGACTPRPSLSPTDTPSPAPATISRAISPNPSTEAFLVSPVSPIPGIEKTLQTPHIDLPPDGAITTPAPASEGCGYQWAYQDLPELSAKFQQMIQSLKPEATASAYAFGEDCVHSDGTKTFLAMETDFNITLQVNDLANEADLGEWIVKVMQVILNIPKEEIMGPRPGRVSITFQSGSGQKPVNFYVDQYQALPPGLSNAEIYQALQIPQ